jgi:hypothetical protein
VVYILSWSVVNGMFPFSAGARSDEGDGKTALITALLLVLLITAGFTVGAWLMPATVWHSILGPGFPSGSENPYTSLLVLYSATTGLYAMSVVLMSYEISRKIGHVSWLQLAFSVAIIGGIYLLHHSLHQVIAVQTAFMALLLATVSVTFLRSQAARRRSVVNHGIGRRTLSKIRRVSEDEVIAEFLKSEFYFPEFEEYRGHLEQVVGHPDLSNERENALRRALLYRRRGPLWRELPRDTEWWEIELQPEDLHRVRVFPRNYWRKLAGTSYYLPDVVNTVRNRIRRNSQESYILKLRDFSRQIPLGVERSSVLMIGVDESGPFTIIEGNHRMTAAGVAYYGEVFPGYRYFCGFSPHMTDCCWYQTDFATLVRYACNLTAHFFEDPNVAINEALSHEGEA